MESKARRIKSLMINSSDMHSLKEPINKILKPTQVYNDSPFKSSDPKQYLYRVAPSPELRKPSHYSYLDPDSECRSCVCDCHKSPYKMQSESIVSTANSKRSKVMSGSPIKALARQIVRSGDQGRNYFSIFPYGGGDSKRTESESHRHGGRKHNKKVSMSFVYL